MHFNTKNYLKSNYYHTAEHSFLDGYRKTSVDIRIRTYEYRASCYLHKEKKKREKLQISSQTIAYRNLQINFVSTSSFFTRFFLSGEKLLSIVFIEKTLFKNFV
jgi:hypothetical protein